jgi:hypothetical protein
MGRYQRIQSLVYQFSVLANLLSGQGCIVDDKRPSENNGQPSQRQGDSPSSTVTDDATITPRLVNSVQEAYAFWNSFEEFNKASRLISCKIDGAPTVEELPCTKAADIASFIILDNYLGMLANIKAKSRRSEIESAIEAKSTLGTQRPKTNLISLTADFLEFLNVTNNEIVSIKVEKDLFEAKVKFFTYPDGKTKAENTVSLVIDTRKKTLTTEANIVDLPDTLPGYQLVTTYDHKAAVRRSKRIGKGDSSKGTAVKTIEMVRGLEENAPSP